MRVAAFAVVVALLASCGSTRNRVAVQQPGQQSQPACLHGPQETPEQAGRKRAAIAFTRQVNTEMSHSSAEPSNPSLRVITPRDRNS